MAQTPEGKVKAKVKRLLNKHNAWSYMPVSGGMGAHGIPDILVCHHGQFIAIECKAPGKRNNVTKLQKLQIDKINWAGGVAMVVADDRDFETLTDLLEGITRVAND